MKEIEILQFVKNATTKSPTELTGSHTFCFTDHNVYAYNNLISIKAKINYDIEGSIPAESFYQLLHKITEDVTIIDKDTKIQVKYGKHSATLHKEIAGLTSYIDIIYPDTYVKIPIPVDFLEAIATSKFQTYSNKFSGVYIDDDIYYAIDTSDISKYESTESFGETFWLPREGIQLLLHVPEEIKKCAIGRSFFYAFTDTFTIAIKLKIAEQFPKRDVEAFINQFDDFSHIIKIPATIKETLDRIKLGTAKDKDDHYIFRMSTGEKLAIVSAGHPALMIHENLPYEKQNVVQAEYEIPIENFLHIITDWSISIMEATIRNRVAVVLALHTDKHTHLVRVRKI